MPTQRDHYNSMEEVIWLLEYSQQILESQSMSAPPIAIIQLARLIAETTERRLSSAAS